MTLLQIEPPTDPQLEMIASLCADRGCVPPDVVCSKQEASEIITAIKARTYDSRKYVYPFDDRSEVDRAEATAADFDREGEAWERQWSDRA